MAPDEAVVEHGGLTLPEVPDLYQGPGRGRLPVKAGSQPVGASYRTLGGGARGFGEGGSNSWRGRTGLAGPGGIGGWPGLIEGLPGMLQRKMRDEAVRTRPRNTAPISARDEKNYLVIRVGLTARVGRIVAVARAQTLRVGRGWGGVLSGARKWR